MKTLITSTAIALALGSAAIAQQQQQPQPQPPAQQEQQQAQQQQQPGAQQQAPFIELGEGDYLASRLVGLAVMAPRDPGQAGQIGQMGGQAIDSAQLAGFEHVGRITDFAFTGDGQPRAVIVTLGAAGQPVEGEARMGEGMATGTVPEAGTGPVAAGMREVAVDMSHVAFLMDDTAPHLIYAVVGATVDDLQQAPMVMREQLPGAGMGDPAAQPGWGGGAAGWGMERAPMAAPAVTMEGWAQIPVTELPVDELIGANVFGVDQQNIGSIGDVIIDDQGQVQYVIIDVGGFLGIGTREVAIGLEEMTVLRDEGLQDLQVHVGATEAMLEQLPEYERGG